MQVTIPEMNAIRFYRTDQTPDWISIFPNYENIRPQVEYFSGIYAASYFSDWVVNNELSLQFRLTVSGTEDLKVFKYNNGSYTEYATINPVNITPTGWISDQVRRYRWTPSETGVYYIESTSAAIRSVKFAVHSSLKLKKRLIQIDYKNSVNDYGMVFDNNGTPVFEGRVYLTGQTNYIDVENETSGYKSDRGDFQKLRTTPIPNMQLKIADIHMAENNKINLIFSCDLITINGLTYQSADKPEIERVENLDVNNFTVQMTRTNYNYLT